MAGEEKDREAIRALVRAFWGKHKRPGPFVPGKTPIPCGGRVFGPEEMESLVDASIDFWLTHGPRAEAFEKGCAELFGVKNALFVNSGSSALLLAIMALADRSLGARRLLPGDEVITPAMGFPTTAAPIIMAGAVPVFVDVELPFYNPSAEAVRAAVTKKTKAIVIAHAMGNPFDAPAVLALARKRGLFVIEDVCDALGSRIHGRLAGTFGDLATLSFYASHHVTCGEGGMVLASSDELAAVVRSLRDWGRDCVCPPGRDNTCGRRFTGRFGALPEGYDHKYVYSRLGFNMKATDLQAAVGLAQIERLGDFTAARRRNFDLLKGALAGLADKLLLPEAAPGSEPSWFGFPLLLKAGRAPERPAVIAALEARRIATRMLLAGNMRRQPAFEGVRFRVAGSLENTDRITRDAFWVGVYPGITEEMCAYMAESIREAVEGPAEHTH